MATLTSAVVRSDTGYIDNTTGTRVLNNNGGAGKMWEIGKILVTNISTTANVILYIYVCPSATTPTTASDNYTLFKAYNISPSNGNSGPESFPELAGLMLEDGQSIFMIAGTVSSLKYYISYFREA